MCLYKIDRVQYFANTDHSVEQFYIYEFIELNDLRFGLCVAELKKHQGLGDADKIIQKHVSPLVAAKLDCLFLLLENYDCKLIIILHTEKDRYCLFKSWEQGIKVLSFAELQKWFLKMNDNGISTGKTLGKAKIEIEDSTDFVNKVLTAIGQDFDSNDDCGLGLTKSLLAGQGTKGFDFDLFQYIESTGEYVIFEFLRRESKFVTNYNAHPMRYCWLPEEHNRKKYDNMKKFISLWKSKQKFNARLFLVNYSNNSETEGIGVSEIVGIDEKHGFTGERKYNLTYREFIEWMKTMSSYQERDLDYLCHYNNKRKVYHENFFRAFDDNKSSYGK